MQGDSGKLSRAWFDVIVLAVAALAAGGAAAYHFWPVGCSNRDVVRQAQEIVRRKLSADRVTFHLIEKKDRIPRELSCVAAARVEFNARNTEYHDVAYQAQIDDGRRIADVRASVKEPER